MSKETEDAAFQKYVEGLKSRLPAEKHSHIDALFGEEAFREETYRGTLRKDEFHRRLNDLNKEKETLEGQKREWTDWWKGEQPKNLLLQRQKEDLERRLNATMAAAGITNDTDPSPAPMKGDVNKQIEELEKRLDVAQNALIQMNTALPHFMQDTLKVNHLIHKGKYDINPADVLAHSMQHKVTVEQAFNVLKEDEDVRRLEAEIVEREKNAREAGRREALSNRTPDYAGRASASPVISHLQGKEDLSDQRTRVRGAAAELRSLLSGGS